MFSSVQPKTVRQSIGRDYRYSVYVKYVNLKEKLLQNQRMMYLNDEIYEVCRSCPSKRFEQKKIYSRTPKKRVVSFDLISYTE